MFGYWVNQGNNGGGTTPSPSSYVDMNQFYSWDIDEIKSKCSVDYIDDDTGPSIVRGTTDDSFPSLISGTDAGIEKIRWIHCVNTGTDAKLECVMGLPLNSSGNIVTDRNFQSGVGNPELNPDWYPQNKEWFDNWCNHLIGVFKLFDFDITGGSGGSKMMKLNTRYASMGVSGNQGPWKIPHIFTPIFGNGYKDITPSVGYYPAAEILSTTEVIIRVPGQPTDGPTIIPALHSTGIWAPYEISTNAVSARFSYVFGGDDGTLTYTCMSYGMNSDARRVLPSEVFLNMCKVVRL